MKKKLLLYGTFLKLRLLMNFQFPASYWLGFAGQILSYGATFCTIFIAVSSFGNLNGWTADEVLLLYAFELISYAIGAFFCFHPSTGLANNIRTGAFDASLTKPINPFVFQILKVSLQRHNHKSQQKPSQPTLKRRCFFVKSDVFLWPGFRKEWC